MDRILRGGGTGSGSSGASEDGDASEGGETGDVRMDTSSGEEDQHQNHRLLSAISELRLVATHYMCTMSCHKYCTTIEVRNYCCACINCSCIA